MDILISHLGDELSYFGKHSFQCEVELPVLCGDQTLVQSQVLTATLSMFSNVFKVTVGII